MTKRKLVKLIRTEQVVTDEQHIAWLHHMIDRENAIDPYPDHPKSDYLPRGTALVITSLTRSQEEPSENSRPSIAVGASVSRHYGDILYVGQIVASYRGQYADGDGEYYIGYIDEAGRLRQTHIHMTQVRLHKPKRVSKKKPEARGRKLDLREIENAHRNK